MRALGFIVKKADIKKMLTEINKLDTGEVTQEEFIHLASAKMGERDTREEIMKVFDLFDEDHTGKITFRNLKRVVQELGEDLTDQDITV